MKKKQDSLMGFNLEPTGFSTAFTDADRSDPRSSRLVKAFEESKYGALYDLAFGEREEWFSPSLDYLYTVASEMVAELVRTPDINELRDRVEMEPDPAALGKLAARVPFIRGSDYVDSDWVSTIWSHLLLEYRFGIRSFDGDVTSYFSSKNDRLKTPGRIFFHLVEDRKLGGFAFVASYSSVSNGKVTHHPLANALKEYSGDKRKLLQLLTGLESVADRSPLMSSLIESGELFHPLSFSPDDAYTFLKEVPVYEEAGIICRIPAWWKNRSRSMSLEMIVGDKGPSLFGAESLLSLRPAVTVDGEELTEAEIRSIIESGRGLAFIKGKWVEADKSTLERALKLFEEPEAAQVTAAEALRMAAGLDESPVPDAEVKGGKWLEDIVRRMREADFEDVGLPDTFKGSLRPYQKRGFNWLCQLRSLGFGACLADDMGLGKTVQVIAYLEKLRSSSGGRHLLVVPASLMGNWQREIAKFAPEMPVSIAHGKGAAGDSFLTITTYGMVRTRKDIAEKQWDSVILDEAQAIKNPGSAQSKAVRALKGYRLAMTGTPVENSLSDMWTLFDFTNRGLLGTASEFKDYSGRIAGDPDMYARIRNVTSPFILRRLKTDKRIIDDLPEKTEIDMETKLTKKQEVLYKDYMQQFAENLAVSDNGAKRGIVLAAITKFKQICDHPDLYLGTDGFDESESGKLQVMRQICENVRDSGERVLVFTQYKEMTGPLSSFLESIFGRKGFVLHGGTSLKDRNDMVRRFNDGNEYIPYMVLSIKAGGVGLNLTAANHVIHFDRWWNPAVENQATDRAFRIGQTRNVMVYRLICQGTIEERVAESIEKKKELAEMVVGTGENWIADLSDSEILDMFRLE